jgi:hypothetical protein
MAEPTKEELEMMMRRIVGQKHRRDPKPFFSASDDVGYGIGPTDLWVNPKKTEIKQAEEYQDVKAALLENLDYKLPEKMSDEDEETTIAIQKERTEILKEMNKNATERERIFDRERKRAALQWKLKDIYSKIPGWEKLNEQESIYEMREALKLAVNDGRLGEEEFKTAMMNIDIMEANYYTGPPSEE